jgi:hypothetical protein
MFMLGTNDLKRRFNLSPSDIAQSASVLAEMAIPAAAAGRRRRPA